MNRRDILRLLGIGITGSIAGCTSNATEVESESVNDTVQDEEKIAEEMENHLEDIYDRRVENDTLKKGHNLEIGNIIDISDDELKLDLVFSLNPVSDYTINLHYIPLTPTEHGQWDYKNYKVYGRMPDYDEESHTWNVNDARYGQHNRYVMEKDRFNNTRVSSLTIPEEAFWEDDVKPPNSEPNYPTNRSHRIDIKSEGVPYEISFDLNETPNEFEPFVYAVSWSDNNTKSPRQNQVVSNTMPIVRTREDKYIYAKTKDGDYTTNPDWGTGTVRNDNRDYELGDVYVNNFERDTTSSKAYISRLSGYGYFTPKLLNEFEDINDVRFTGTGPEYFNREMQLPWAISYEITAQERTEAEEIASENRIRGGSQLGAVYSYINSPEVMNHDKVQEVAQKLGDVCEVMGATHPVEQVRVVADFVQYMSHTSHPNDDSPLGEGTRLAPGTATPVETLARGRGDCKDYTVLTNALLEQEPFNFNPNALVIPEVFDFNADGSVGHVTTSVSRSELGLTDVDLREFGSPMHGKLGTRFIDGDMHLYIETSAPFEIGFVYDTWYRNSSIVPIERHV